MVTSQLWAAQEALYALLQGTNLGKAKLHLGTPTEYTDDEVWVDGQVDDWSGEYRVSGLAAKDEDFVLQVKVMCNRLTTDYLLPRNAVKAFGLLIEGTINADFTLGGTVMLATPRSFRLEDTLTDERHRAVKLTMLVACSAWAT